MKRKHRILQHWMVLDSYLHLHGKEAVRIENCRRILEYNEVLVRVQTYDLTVAVWGTGLRVFDYNDSEVIVRGDISSVELAEVK
ncbi:MAG: YabP/YqfC family sporulation protein [Oscillospiraceae bacterium]|nr:YabP/YqfC family sporulation protein [Oscillospiraceae bacterium]MBQ9696310.1 YabP/YqfC family sporulation protein [Oscillospiraceae bacterium]MBR1898900.1 YabP/YqfC family sporulation protein [Oscillospiraceae bacterium]